MMYRQTIVKEVILEGIGLHLGKVFQLRLAPATSGTGLYLQGISLDAWQIEPSGWATRISYGHWRISTLEHLLGFIFLAKIDDLHIDVTALNSEQALNHTAPPSKAASAQASTQMPPWIDLEIPIFDGSALIYQQSLMAKAALPLTKRAYQACREPIQLQYLESSISIEPYDRFELKYRFEFSGLPCCELYFKDEPSQARERLLSARTFGFLSHEKILRAQGLIQGVHLENCLIFDDQQSPIKAMNSPRFEQEPAYHKLLDILGDLMRINQRFFAKIEVIRGSHQLHAQAVELLRAQWQNSNP
jgi:UDP-3-O-acyl-N-acetylglucosamine deacetylase